LNLIQAINTYLWVWLETFKGLRRPVVILPFLAYGLIEMGLLWSSSHFYERPWGYLWVPVLSWFPGAGSLHYPSYFLALPMLLGRLDLVLSALVGSLTVGWGILVFRDTFVASARNTGSGLGVALGRAVPLIVIGVLVATLTMLLQWAVNALGHSLLKAWLEGSPVRGFALQFLVNVVLQAALVYVPVVLLLSERGLPAALGEGLGFFWRHRVMSILLVLLPLLLLVPLSLPVLDVAATSRLAAKLEPEAIFKLCALTVAAAALISLLLAGATVRFFLYRTRQDRPAAAAPQGA
jgi:hypothetical protein